MRIGIEVRSLSRPKTGIGNHTFNLLKNLIKIARDDHFFIYTCRDFDDGILKDASNVTIRKFPFPIGTLWAQTVLPVLISRDSLDVFHSPETMVPILGKTPSIATVLDLISFIHPNGHDFKARMAAKLYPSVFNKSKKLIAISKSTKDDLNKMFGIPEEKVAVVPISYDEDLFRPVESPCEILRKYGIKLPYVLFVGVLSPRKNVGRLIEAHAMALKKGLDVDLVIAGPFGWQYEGIFERARDLDLADRVRFIGPVPGDDLPQLYSGASVFVFPSLYEGFGIPVLEAMACGTPVVTSNISSLPEIAGDAAVIVDPRNTEEIADAMCDLISNDARSKVLIEKGLERAKEYSWKKTAENTLAIYREVVQA